MLLGAIPYGLVCLAERVAGPRAPAPVLAFVVLALGAILTRGLHLDGLADWADGIGAGRDRERALAIMKDPHTGAFGAIALGLDLVGRFAALVVLLGAGRGVWIVAAATISRTAQVGWAAFLPYARADGTAAAFVRGARVWHFAAALALGAGLLFAMGGAPALALLAGGLSVAAAFGFHARRRFGGITGDLLGAGNEWVEVVLLLASAALFI
jgi:adenosylcobinamide-GDP ribazoletransferase